MFTHSWHPVLMLSSIFNGDLVMFLSQVIHLDVAAIGSFTAHGLRLISRFTQTWKHICLASCPWVFVVTRGATATLSGPRTLALCPLHVQPPLCLRPPLPGTDSLRPHSRLKADRLSCFLLFLNLLRICPDRFTSQLCHCGYMNPWSGS